MVSGFISRNRGSLLRPKIGPTLASRSDRSSECPASGDDADGICGTAGD
jgi:hypothetical protein